MIAASLPESMAAAEQVRSVAMKLSSLLLPLAIALALLALHPADATAQIVNVQSRIGEVPQGFSGQLEGTLDWRTGNVDLLATAGAATLRYRHDRHLAFAIARGEYGRSGEPSRRFMARTFAHLRYRRELTPLVAIEGFGQHELDRFRRLELRALVGAGPRFTLLSGGTFGLALGTAYMLEREALDDNPDASDAGRSTTTHRLSSYAIFSIKANENVSLVNTIYFQPAFADPGDLRLLEELSLVAKLSGWLAVKTAYALAYDAAPPSLLESTDSSLQTSLLLQF
jgi:putative salt-induced outer membrane protein YdiY